MFEEKFTIFPLIFSFFFTKSTLDNCFPQWHAADPVCMAQKENGTTLLKSFDTCQNFHNKLREKNLFLEMLDYIMHKECEFIRFSIFF